tara:strand:+ start:506 stop:913 length:408 start_codon:yes stop_codon:yes gene_type:complete
MYDSNTALENKIAFYSDERLVNDPFHPAGFNGTWKFSDHNLIPDVLVGFLQRHFGHYRLSRIPLASINEVMNNVWEGPGSLTKIFRIEHEYMTSGKELRMLATDLAKVKILEEEETSKKDDEDILFENLFSEEER